jgi:hypothetical protein
VLEGYLGVGKGWSFWKREAGRRALVRIIGISCFLDRKCKEALGCDGKLRHSRLVKVRVGAAE